MNFSPANVLAGSFALLLHAGVAGVFFVDWDSEQPIELNAEKTYYIPAKMYAENPHTAKQEREAAATQLATQLRQQKAAERRRQDAARKKAAEQKRLDEAKAKEIADQREADRLEKLRAEQLASEKRQQELEAAEREAQRRADEEAERLAQADDELQKLINAEIDAIAAVTDDEKAMAYVGQIQADIIQNWSRPPSARNGMQALLKVFLVPTGEVVDVSVITSSGNEAFDRSAIQAVRKVRRFEVPGDARLFEEKFREFEVLFRPEDLRL